MAFDRALTVSDGMVRSMVSIGRLVGRDEAAGLAEPDPAARRRARARAVHASLALGGGTLSEGQVAALAWGRAVAGPDPDALGGENACRAYAALLGLAPHSAEDLLWAHGTITGRPVVETPEGVSDLLSWVGHTTAHPLVAACVAHCEILCTLPFAEGDGALARLWQAAVLCRWSGVFTYLPVESEVWGREEGYRRALGVAGATGDAVPFVAFMLDAIGASLSRAVAGRDPAPLDREGPRALQGRLLALFRDRPDLSLAQAARALGATVRQVERCASRLKAEGRLRRVGPRHGGGTGRPSPRRCRAPGMQVLPDDPQARHPKSSTSPEGRSHGRHRDGRPPPLGQALPGPSPEGRRRLPHGLGQAPPGPSSVPHGRHDPRDHPGDFLAVLLLPHGPHYRDLRGQRGAGLAGPHGLGRAWDGPRAGLDRLARQGHGRPPPGPRRRIRRTATGPSPRRSSRTEGTRSPCIGACST